MNPDQPGQSQQNPYDFILNPQPSQRRSGLRLPDMGNSFARKIAFILGGALILIILMWIMGSILGGNKINTADIASLAQSQQEIIRVAELGGDAVSQDTQNKAATVALSLKSQQKAWLDVLDTEGAALEDDQLKILQNDATDEQLEEARRNNNFDAKFAEVMRTYLQDYSAVLDNNHRKATGTSERELLEDQFAQTELLLKLFE